jgi:hypothetical protein
MAAAPARAAQPAATAAGAAAAAAAAAGSAPVDAYEARVARLVAPLPPEEASADLRAVAAAFELFRSGEALVGDPGAGAPALAQGAADLLRADALLGAVTGPGGVTIDATRATEVLTARGSFSLEAAAAAGALELALLLLALLASEALGTLEEIVAKAGGARGAAQYARFCAVERELLAAADFWAAPGRAEAAAARLAALGVERAEHAAADVLAALLHAVGVGQINARGDVDARVLERAGAANPLALATAANLAHSLALMDARGFYAVAMCVLQRADRAGHSFAAVRLLIAAQQAVVAGALGPDPRCDAVRPLLEGARRRLDAARRDVPRAAWLEIDAEVRRHEAIIAGVANATVLRVTGPQEVTVKRAAHRTCARCGEEQLEALKCSRCGAFYCSASCRRCTGRSTRPRACMQLSAFISPLAPAALGPLPRRSAAAAQRALRRPLLARACCKKQPTKPCLCQRQLATTPPAGRGLEEPPPQHGRRSAQIFFARTFPAARAPRLGRTPESSSMEAGADACGSAAHAGAPPAAAGAAAAARRRGRRRRRRRRLAAGSPPARRQSTPTRRASRAWSRPCRPRR